MLDTLKSRAFLVPCATILAAYIVLISLTFDSRVHCQEDEIVAWDGDAHTVCVNLDEIDEYYETTFPL